MTAHRGAAVRPANGHRAAVPRRDGCFRYPPSPPERATRRAADSTCVGQPMTDQGHRLLVDGGRVGLRMTGFDGTDVGCASLEGGTVSDCARKTTPDPASSRGLDVWPTSLYSSFGNKVPPGENGVGPTPTDTRLRRTTREAAVTVPIRSIPQRRCRHAGHAEPDLRPRPPAGTEAPLWAGRRRVPRPHARRAAARHLAILSGTRPSRPFPGIPGRRHIPGCGEHGVAHSPSPALVGADLDALHGELPRRARRLSPEEVPR